MKSDNIQLESLFKPLAQFLKRFHTLLFFLVVSGSLFVAILLIISVVNLSSTTATSAEPSVSGSFDEQTIDRIEKSAEVPSKPTGRQSPFTE